MALIKLHCRSYWTRLWIIQECVLAKDVMILCGSRSIEWKTLLRARKLLLDQFESRFGLQTTIKESFAYALERIGNTSVPDRTLEHVLNVSYGSLCVNPLDKIFGIIGMVNGAGLHELASPGMPGYYAPTYNIDQPYSPITARGTPSPCQ
jgi:hypothetical protein